MTPSTVRGFAAVYALLAFLVVGSGLGAYAAYESHGTASRVQHVQAELGSQNLADIAAKYVAQAAQAQGFVLKSFKVLSTVVHGDEAVVTARIVVTDGLSEQTFTVKVHVTRGIWTVDSMTVA